MRTLLIVLLWKLPVTLILTALSLLLFIFLRGQGLAVADGRYKSGWRLG